MTPSDGGASPISSSLADVDRTPRAVVREPKDRPRFEPLESASTGARAPFAFLERHGGREQLYQELEPLVRRLIRQYGADDPELRQDLAGEIYWRFRKLTDNYDPDRGVPLRPYLIRMLTASVYSYARQYRASRSREVSLEERAGTAGSDGVGTRSAAGRSPERRADAASYGVPPVGGLGVDPTPSWDEAMVKEQILDCLPARIQALPTRQRQVVIWCYYEQRSFDEIAGALRVRPATVRSLLRHGLARLRAGLAPTAG